jgi:hypothetical protein
MMPNHGGGVRVGLFLCVCVLDCLLSLVVCMRKEKRSDIFLYRWIVLPGILD